MGANYGVLPWPRRNRYLNRGIALRKGREFGFDEGVHTAGRTGPVAVVEFELLALEDEGADAILSRALIFGA